MNPRKVVLDILRRFEEHSRPFEAVVDRTLNRSGIDRRDRRFVYELVHGILRQRIRLRYVIQHFLSDPQLARNEDLVRVLELGLYQILYLDRVPNHAAVSESVELAKRNPRTRRQAGVVNAVLRAAINARGMIPLPDPKKNLTGRLAVEYAHPQWLVERWLSKYGLSATRTLLQYNNRLPTTFLRRRLRGMGRQRFEADTRGICDRVGGYGNLYYRLARKGMSPDELRLFQLGECTVQSPSAGWVVAMLSVQPGERIVDVCSAPGGKTTLMAELCGHEGSVCACDNSPWRVRRVVDGARRMQLDGIYPVVCDGRFPPFAGYFDKVLLDAPCTGTGVLQRHPDARTTRTADDIGRIARVQEELLEAAVDLVGHGGTIVYATCSLEPEENEAQVVRFLERHKDFTLEKPPRDIPRQYVDLDGHLRITPFEHDMDGAFAALLRRR
ncbi:MAG: 16S rRNA (cytosine(967)-C(5))-methyltransferase RsmB [Chitinivibrionales bacterium]|nr:16S rRNA (cytosine(967)-C(5))-methyltransferase RsmB [Chitinivibrionales bacterium]